MSWATTRAFDQAADAQPPDVGATVLAVTDVAPISIVQSLRPAASRQYRTNWTFCGLAAVGVPLGATVSNTMSLGEARATALGCTAVGVARVRICRAITSVALRARSVPSVRIWLSRMLRPNTSK